MYGLRILKMYSQNELAKIWKCTQQNVSLKLKHNSVTVRELCLVLKAHPEDREQILAGLK